MILNMVYLLIGLLVGFLVKHELDIKERKKRVEQKLKVVKASVEPYNNTIDMLRELNASLLSAQQKKKEVR